MSKKEKVGWLEFQFTELQNRKSNLTKSLLFIPIIILKSSSYSSGIVMFVKLSFQSDGWIVHSTGVPDKKVIGSKMSPITLNTLKYSL